MMDPVTEQQPTARDVAPASADRPGLSPLLISAVIFAPFVLVQVLVLPVRVLTIRAATIYNALGIPLIFVLSALILCRCMGLDGSLRLVSPKLNLRAFGSTMLLFLLFQVLFAVFFRWTFLPAPDVSVIRPRWPILDWSLFRSIVGSPIGEEMLWRGWLLSWLSSRDGEYMVKGWLTRANCATSLAFTIAHFTSVSAWGSLVGIFLISLIMGLARERTDSLALPMFLHFLTNLLEKVVW